jgi:hypothetical protein
MTRILKSGGDSTVVITMLYRLRRVGQKPIAWCAAVRNIGFPPDSWTAALLCVALIGRSVAARLATAETPAAGGSGFFKEQREGPWSVGIAVYEIQSYIMTYCWVHLLYGQALTTLE